MSEILFADDDPAMREMVWHVLRAAGHRVRLVSDGRAALRAVEEAAPDLIVLDYRMGPLNGFEVCRSLKADPRFEHLPVMILTAESGLEDRIQGFGSGADDYLPKPFDARELSARVHALLRLTRQGLDRNPTSGLPGGEAIPREFARRRQLGHRFTIVYLDIDHFKPFGDRFGFSTADAVIHALGRILSEATAGSESFAGHVGGDDFILFTTPELARRQVEEVRRHFHAALAALLPPEVMAAGTYHSTDRNGMERDFPLTRLATAIVHAQPDRLGTLAELGEAVAGYKRMAKQDLETGVVEVELPERAGGQGGETG